MDGAAITSDKGGLLLREVGKRTSIIERFQACFSNCHDPERVGRGEKELAAQQVYELGVG